MHIATSATSVNGLKEIPLVIVRIKRKKKGGYTRTNNCCAIGVLRKECNYGRERRKNNDY